jgi:RHS repeat-associated protein
MVTDSLHTELHDYFPFGGEVSRSGNWRFGLASDVDSAGIRLKFTGKERDAETGLDYFGARYFSSAQGRFTSPDAPLIGQHPSNPQSWNLYSYNLNNPLRFVDPTGHDPEEPDPGDKEYDCGRNLKDCGPAIKIAQQEGLDWDKMADKQKAAAVGLAEIEQLKQRDKQLLVWLQWGGILASFVGGEGLLEGEPAELMPYGEGGGHHVPAKSAFIDVPGYDVMEAPAIPLSALEKAGVSHSLVTGAQQTLYREFAQTGRTLTWADSASIETKALIKGGMDPAVAKATVQKAINTLKDAGVSGPVRIPWGK